LHLRLDDDDDDDDAQHGGRRASARRSTSSGRPTLLAARSTARTRFGLSAGAREEIASLATIPESLPLEAEGAAPVVSAMGEANMPARPTTFWNGGDSGVIV
jgi:hypothetical protein